MSRVSSFTFGSYKIDKNRSIISFRYRVNFKFGFSKTFTDRLILPKVGKEQWDKIPKEVLEPTLQSLLLMLGINYWCVFPTRDIRIEGFKLTREQAKFWDFLYLNGLGEFFYDMKMDFHDLVSFPYDDSTVAPIPVHFELPAKSLLLNGAGKDSILSAEILKALGASFDFFAFTPTPAHKKIAELVGAKNVEVSRRKDKLLGFIASLYRTSYSYPSVSTFTFVAVLLAQVIGYDSIVFSNERSADFGNLNYLGLEVNHQWCKSSEAEKMTNDYIQHYITVGISTKSLLREYSELEIVRRFVKYPKYLRYVTSCNNYFWLPRPMQILSKKGYWCGRCPKCVFLFACFTAFLPKKEVVDMFGTNLYENEKLLPTFRRILGIEGFKPLDCVGEPEEMILAMHIARGGGGYEGEPAIKMFHENFPLNYDFESIKKKILE